MNLRFPLRWNTELVIAILFLLPQVNYFLANIMDMNGLSTITPLLFVVAYSLGIMSYWRTLRTSKGILYMFTFVVLMIASILLNDQVINYMIDENFVKSNVITFFFLNFPLFLLLLIMRDFNLLMKYLLKGSLLVLCLAITLFLFLLLIKSSKPVDYMSFAYMMLSPIIICFVEGWRKNKKLLICPIVSSFILFVIGCRGALVTLLVFLMLCFCKYYLFNKTSMKYLVIKIFFLLGAFLIVFNMGTLLRQLSDILVKIGFSSRTLEFMLLGNDVFIQSEGRNMIWNQAIENVGILGKGLFGDRTVLLDEYLNPIYPHNFILEILVDFGMILGPVLLVIFAAVVGKALLVSLKSGDSQQIQMSFAMISVFLVRHMVSASFLTSLDFWFYIGLTINWIIYRNYNDNYKIK